jgi:hypothetical protein
MTGAARSFGDESRAELHSEHRDKLFGVTAATAHRGL